MQRGVAFCLLWRGGAKPTLAAWRSTSPLFREYAPTPRRLRRCSRRRLQRRGGLPRRECTRSLVPALFQRRNEEQRKGREREEVPLRRCAEPRERERKWKRFSRSRRLVRCHSCFFEREHRRLFLFLFLWFCSLQTQTRPASSSAHPKPQKTRAREGSTPLESEKGHRNPKQTGRWPAAHQQRLRGVVGAARRRRPTRHRLRLVLLPPLLRARRAASPTRSSPRWLCSCCRHLHLRSPEQRSQRRLRAPRRWGAGGTRRSGRGKRERSLGAKALSTSVPGRASFSRSRSRPRTLTTGRTISRSCWRPRAEIWTCEYGWRDLFLRVFDCGRQRGGGGVS